MTEKHPYKPFLNENTKTLIIGTTPPMRFTQGLEKSPDDVDFYYGSRDNYFWDLMSDIFNTSISRNNNSQAIDERKKLLQKHNIGLIDIVLEFERTENNASDNNLHVIKFQNIYEILKTHSKIEKIFFTGYSSTRSAESLTSRHLGEYKVYNTIVSKDSPKHKKFKIENREIHSYSLYSPSPSARKKYEVILQQYKTYLGDF